MGMSTIRGVFERSTEAFNRHDMQAFRDLMTDDVSCAAPGNVALHGKEQVGAFYQAWIDGFPDARVTVRDVHVMDDCVVEEGTFHGTHRGVLRTPDGDLPPTGRSVNAQYVQVIRMDGERMASLQLTYDRLELLQQLGVAAGPTTAAEGRQRTAPPSPM